MQSFFIKLINKLITSVFSQQLKEDNSFSLKKFVVEDNPFQKYGLAAAGGTVVSFVSILLMALLIATGEVSLDDMELRKIVDVVMPVRDPELIDSIERPEEAEPEPDQLPPEVDIENIEDLLDQSVNPNLNFQRRRSGVFMDGSYVPIFQVPPQYPRRAAERGIEGCVVLKYVVTEVGSVRDPEVIQSIPQGIFDRAAIRAALRYKYKPLIRDGNAVEVEGVTQRITFVLEGEGKGPGYIPENCRGVQG
jgi:protein TonB|tara:strand:+ start:165 stop:911 length:747 start_codon:yes stop_codon:yes gene_type:complete